MSDSSAELITLKINGDDVSVPPGTTVAAAVMMLGALQFRRSVTGEPRGPLCGMGICYECRVTIDGHAHSKSCQLLCRDGMDVSCDD
jgi:aerobic-type carbon monoxide dehydrogenase small subunit (CoxS/CutS family)